MQHIDPRFPGGGDFQKKKKYLTPRSVSFHGI